MITVLACSCKYDTTSKRVVRYCRGHLDQQIKNNIATQNQIQADMRHQERIIARENALKKATGLHLNPYIFGKKKKYYLKPLF